jgi:hypothetical protein
MSHLYLGSCGLCVRVVWQKKLTTWLHILLYVGLTTSAFFEWVWESLWTNRLASMRETRTERERETNLFSRKEKEKKRVRALVRRHRVYLVVGNAILPEYYDDCALAWPSRQLHSFNSLSDWSFWVGHESPPLSLYPPPIAPKDGRWLSEQPEFSVVLPSSFKRDLYLAFTRPTSIYTFTFCRPPPLPFSLALDSSIEHTQCIHWTSNPLWSWGDLIYLRLYTTTTTIRNVCRSWYSVTVLFTFPTPAPLIYTLGLSLSLSLCCVWVTHTLLHQTHFLLVTHP